MLLFQTSLRPPGFAAHCASSFANIQRRSDDGMDGPALPLFHRLLTRRALLYTEMLTTGAVIHGDRARLMGFDPARASAGLPARRLEPRDLAAQRVGADFGIDEINLNAGCPSDRVQNGASAPA